MDDAEAEKRDAEATERMRRGIADIQQMSSENIAKRLDQITAWENQAKKERKENRFKFFRRKKK